jgi:acetyltransferase-like isoleucine patch superfamily enzyme
MLQEILYLWHSREKPKNFPRLLKVWGKRLFHLYGVCRLLTRSDLFRMRGASIGHLVVLGKSRIGGRLSNLTIGNESSLGRCEIALHDKVTIGRCVVINDGAVLLTASHSLTDPKWGHKKAPIAIGDYAWIATNAMILPGVTIGRGAVVGAGAVVRSNVPDYAVVAGNPAAPMPSQRSPELSYSPVMLNAPFEAWVGPCYGRSDGGRAT